MKNPVRAETSKEEDRTLNPWGKREGWETCLKRKKHTLF